MRKRILALLLTATLTLTSIGLAAAQAERDNEIQVKIDGKVITLTNKPVIIDGRTMLPVRAIAEALDCDIIYEPVTKVVSITKEGMDPIHIIIGNEGSFISEEGRTYVPLRYIAEKFGAKVEWNSETRTVEITTTSEDTSVVVEEPATNEPQPAPVEQKKEPAAKEVDLNSIIKGGFKNLVTEDGRGVLEAEIVTKDSFPLQVGDFIVKDISLLNTGLNSPYGDEYIGVTCESRKKGTSSDLRMLLVDQNGLGRYRSAIGFDEGGIANIFLKKYPLAKGLNSVRTIKIGEIFTNIYSIVNGGFDETFDKDAWKFKAESVKYIGLYDYTKNKIFFIEIDNWK